jgi:hypothetical protein
MSKEKKTRFIPTPETDYGGNPNHIPLGGKGKSSPGGKFGSIGAKFGSRLGLKTTPGTQKRKLQFRGKGKARGGSERGGNERADDGVDNDGGDDDDVPYFYTNGSKRMSLDADLASTEKRQKRAARFATPKQSTAGPRKKSLNLMASINMTLTSGESRRPQFRERTCHCNIKLLPIVVKILFGWIFNIVFQASRYLQVI